MAKRKKREVAAPSSTNGAVQGFAERLRADSNKLHELRLACGQLKRSQTWGPEQLEKFVLRVFNIAGVENEEQPAQASAAGA